MAKTKSHFVCQSCGQQSPRWVGRCADCGEWNSFVEEAETRRAPGAPRTPARPVSLAEISTQHDDRVPIGISEMDRVLGGGLVPGSVTLIGGDPGIGKSTLLLQIAGLLGSREAPTLYVSGEESLRQIKLRADRLGVKAPGLTLLAENALEHILAVVSDVRPAALIIDSVQTVYTESIHSAPGSVSQVREAAGLLTAMAKKENISLFLIGHVTKDGSIAGPRVLEHMVDTVLYFEGDRGHAYRILRTMKNRFGSTQEVGVFQMKENGLAEVVNPSEIFLAERPADVAGSAVVASLEGTRPILVERRDDAQRTGRGSGHSLRGGVELPGPPHRREDAALR
jgi:DNA repair protein RadA/Sms